MSCEENKCTGCFEANISGCIESLKIEAPGLVEGADYIVTIEDFYGNIYQNLIEYASGILEVPAEFFPEGFFQMIDRPFKITVTTDEDPPVPVSFSDSEGNEYSCISVTAIYSDTENDNITFESSQECEAKTFCERIVECISADEGNALTTGSDGGLYVSESGGGGGDGFECSDLESCGNFQDVKSKANSAVQPEDLATVATTGSYNDLADQPSIPAAQIQSDWNQANNAALDFIKNKPTIPTATSQLTNDSGFITASAIKFKLLADFGNTAVNTNTSNNVLGSVLIPANTITGNAIIEVESAISRAVAGANPLHRIMINTSASFTGATQIAGISTSTTALWAKGERSFKAQTGILIGYNATNYQGIDDISNANAPTQTAVDWTVDQYILTVANNATGETTTHELTSVKVIHT